VRAIQQGAGAVKQSIPFTLNGKPTTVEAAAGDLLLDVLRGDLGLTGSRFGCGQEQCGACAVLIDGEVRASCVTDITTLEGRSVLTVEGLGAPERPHPLQTAFLELQAGQCGYCLSGILIGAKALLDRNPDPSRAEIAAALSWHLCRCGVHNRVMDAVALAAKRMRKGAPG
jgi:nicotinate dehydrogenase subunit A